MELKFYTGKDNHSILGLVFSDTKDRINNVTQEESLKLAIQGHHILRLNYVVIENKDKQGHLSKLKR